MINGNKCDLTASTFSFFLSYLIFSTTPRGFILAYVSQFPFISTHPALETLLPMPSASPVSTSHFPPPPPPSLLTPSPSPSLLAAPPGRLIDSVPGGGGSCHISNLASPPPDKSYIPPSFDPALTESPVCFSLNTFFLHFFFFTVWPEQPA